MLNIEYVFPTLIAFEDNVFSEEENTFIKNRCIELSDISSNTHMGWLAGKESPKNSFGIFDFTQDPQMSFFIDKITSKVHDFAEHNNDMQEYGCFCSWFNLYESSQYQEPHAHKGSTYSCVYFPYVPENSSPIVFLNPNISELGTQSEEFPNSFHWLYQPRERMILIFRSNLAHYVLPGKNKDLRISIASNFMITPSFYEKQYYRKE